MSPGIVNVHRTSSHTHLPNNQTSLDTLELIADLNIVISHFDLLLQTSKRQSNIRFLTEKLISRDLTLRSFLLPKILTNWQAL